MVFEGHAAAEPFFVFEDVASIQGRYYLVYLQMNEYIDACERLKGFL